MRIRFLFVLTACTGLAGRLNAAEPSLANVPDRHALALFRAGWEAQRQAEAVAPKPECRPLFEKAISNYTAAAAIKTNAYPVEINWARCLQQLAALDSDPKQRRSLARSAYDRFKIAAACEEADWRVYASWGQMLSSQPELLAPSPAKVYPVLLEAKDKLEKALELARFSGEIAFIERDLGLCLIQMGQAVTDSGKRRDYYTQAIRKLESVTAKSPATATARLFGMWGVAQVQLAKLNNDRMLLRQAVERLQTSLEMDPNNGETRYNLVCAYALLEQPEAAMRHLRLCLANDPNRVYYNAAAADPDLDSLRRTADFNQIFGANPTSSSVLDRPPISSR